MSGRYYRAWLIDAEGEIAEGPFQRRVTARRVADRLRQDGKDIWILSREEMAIYTARLRDTPI